MLDTDQIDDTLRIAHQRYGRRAMYPRGGHTTGDTARSAHANHSDGAGAARRSAAAGRTENLPMRFDAGAAVHRLPRHPLPLSVSPVRCVAAGSSPGGVVTPLHPEQNAASFQEAA